MEDKDFEQLRELWQRGNEPATPFSKSELQELMQQIRNGRTTRYRRDRRDARKAFALSLTLLTACCILAAVALLRDKTLLWLPALLFGLPALWQSTNDGHCLYLLWQLAPSRHTPSATQHYAERLAAVEKRLEDRRQQLARYVKPVQQPAFRYYTNGLAVCCCILLLWGVVGGVTRR